MLNKRTFGATPAAIYLADTLNALANPQQTHKVASVINNANKLINEAVELHLNGKMSTKMLYYIVDKVAKDVDNTAEHLQYYQLFSPLICDLMDNVIRGRIKSIKRRLESVVRIKRQQQREATKVKTSSVKCNSTVIGKMEFIPTNITINSVIDSTNESTLTVKSVRRLRRKGIPTTVITQE